MAESEESYYIEQFLMTVNKFIANIKAYIKRNT